MISFDHLHQTIEELNSDRKSTFAEFIDKLFHGKFIAIYLGDAYEDISVEQISQAYPAVFCGKVEGAYKEVLVINSAAVDRRTKKMKLGNLMFINERAIRALNQVDAGAVFDDLFLRGRDAVTIKETFKNDPDAKK